MQSFAIMYPVINDFIVKKKFYFQVIHVLLPQQQFTIHILQNYLHNPKAIQHMVVCKIVLNFVSHFF
jgi:hypothetical protein